VHQTKEPRNERGGREWRGAIWEKCEVTKSQMRTFFLDVPFYNWEPYLVNWRHAFNLSCKYFKQICYSKGFVVCFCGWRKTIWEIIGVTKDQMRKCAKRSKMLDDKRGGNFFAVTKWKFSFFERFPKSMKTFSSTWNQKTMTKMLPMNWAIYPVLRWCNYFQEKI